MSVMGRKVAQKVDAVVDLEGWLKEQRERLESGKAGADRQRIQDENQRQAEAAWLIRAFAPLAAYIDRLAKAGVEVEDSMLLDRDRTTHQTVHVRMKLVRPEAGMSDYVVRFVWDQQDWDHKAADWGFGVRAVRKDGPVVFENYDFAPGHAQEVTGVDVKVEEALRSFMAKIEAKMVAVGTPSL
jgi:hypothetical protein